MPLCLRGLVTWPWRRRRPRSRRRTIRPPGAWAKKAPAELGLDPVKLQEAVDFAQSRESNREMDFSDQERIFGTLLGSVPNIRARTNGVVIYKGYVVAEFGDTTWVDPTYSVAKSMLATVAGIAMRDGLIKNLDAPIGDDRSRTAATTRRATRRSRGSITCSRPASGKATCGASRTTSSARKPSARAR